MKTKIKKLPKLKKCPFCGKKAEIHFELHDIGDYQVMCSKCGATCGGLVYSKEEAINEWNQRYIEPVKEIL